jgi:hypothetical protein
MTTTASGDAKFSSISLECTADGHVKLHLDGTLLGTGDRLMSPDVAVALAAALAARAAEARLMLEAVARRIAEAEHREVERIAAQMPLSVAPAAAREAARAILAAFDVTPRETP